MKHQGLIVPLVTPLTLGGALDEASLVGLIQHVIAGGVDGLFVLGTTGEAPSLSMPLRRQAIKAIAAVAPACVPLYVCITDCSAASALATAAWAADAGAAAVVAAPPYYYPIDDGELLEYYRSLCRQLPLPLLLYNMPTTTKSVLGPGLVERLSSLPQIIGLKDSGGDLSAFQETQRRVSARTDFAMFMGDERLFADAVLAGASGGVSGGANVLPELFSGVYAAARSGDAAVTRAAQRRVVDFGRLYSIGRRWGRHIANLKFALSLMGVCQEHTASPLSAPSPTEQSAIAKWLEEMTLARQESAGTSIRAQPVVEDKAGGDGHAVRAGQSAADKQATPAELVR